MFTNYFICILSRHLWIYWGKIGMSNGGASVLNTWGPLGILRMCRLTGSLSSTSIKLSSCGFACISIHIEKLAGTPPDLTTSDDIHQSGYEQGVTSHQYGQLSYSHLPIASNWGE